MSALIADNALRMSEMHHTHEIELMAARIKAGLQCRVFLFGSHAWGRPNACSDVDLAVIVSDQISVKNPNRIAAKLSLHGLIPTDFIWLKESTLSNALPGSLAFKIRTEGKEL